MSNSKLNASMRQKIITALGWGSTVDEVAECLNLPHEQVRSVANENAAQAQGSSWLIRFIMVDRTNKLAKKPDGGGARSVAR